MAIKSFPVRVLGKNQVTLPARLVEKLHLRKGDTLQAMLVKDRIELVPTVAIPREQAWFWTPEWQAMEGEANAARAAGDFVEFNNVDDFLDSLDK